MQNILIRGCPGTGKTFISRALAYYISAQRMTMQDAFKQDYCADWEKIEQFLSTDSRCEYIQVHQSMEFDDVVYGLEIKANNGIAISYAEKRIMKLCKDADGKTDTYCIILDDINRSNSSNLLGNLLYAMEYRGQDIVLPDGNTMCIPDNVVLIFTENTLDVCNGLDLAVRRRMTYLKELKSDRDVIKKYYSTHISSQGINLILSSFDRISDYIISYSGKDSTVKASDYIPGHGMFIVPRVGNQHYILDCFRQKIKLQVFPYLRELFSRGIITTNPDSFIESLNTSINVGVEGICPISDVNKQMIRSGVKVNPFSLEDSRNYYKNVIVPAKCIDFRGMMECIIDAMLLNKIFPYDVLLDSLLKNTSIAYIESLHAPIDKAAYIVEKHKANRFMYETVRGGRVSGTHAYYSLDSAVTGRWGTQNDTEEYVVSYDDKQDVEFIPLSGFRNHGFDPDSPKLGVQHNTVNIMTAVHILLTEYYKLYETNIRLVMDNSDQYNDLLNLIGLEKEYLDTIKQCLKGRSPGAPTGDDKRLAFYGEKIANLRLLWNGVNDSISVDPDKEKALLNGTKAFSLESYEDMFLCDAGMTKTIEIKGVLKMVDLKDYQKIMDNIGIRQMIFQGPPGTSKTFESKKFVLKQLNPSAASLSAAFASQDSISNDLDAYKLTDADYADPEHSPKLLSGGWDLVQFHPSYGYEDFIRGIEVKIPTGATTPSYESVNRILGKIAEFSKISADKATAGREPKFYLIVDEINRANLATVFGELIYGLEYRNSKVSTPYEVKEKIGGAVTKDIVLRKNLYILGTMNTADKSIDSIDYAIRRRFIFVDSPANRDVVLNCYKNVSGNDDENSIELLLFDAVQTLFDGDRFFNNEYQKSDVKIGHTYFLRDRKRGYDEAFIEHFVFQVIPILREYVKDGILDSTENLVPLEHTVSEIHSVLSGEEQLKLLSENIMLYVKEFGNLNKSNVLIDNAYIGTFLDNLRKEFSY